MLYRSYRLTFGLDDTSMAVFLFEISEPLFCLRPSRRYMLMRITFFRICYTLFSLFFSMEFHVSAFPCLNPHLPFYFHDAFITTVCVPSMPKRPATAQKFGQPYLISCPSPSSHLLTKTDYVIESKGALGSTVIRVRRSVVVDLTFSVVTCLLQGCLYVSILYTKPRNISGF
jgi:hypothetical protein